MIKCLLAIFVLNTIYCETYCNLSSASCKKDESSYTKLMKKGFDYMYTE
jgi:hypothetical protein